MPTDRHMTKLRVVFRNYANAPKTALVYLQRVLASTPTKRKLRVNYARAIALT